LIDIISNMLCQLTKCPVHSRDDRYRIFSTGDSGAKEPAVFSTLPKISDFPIGIEVDILSIRDESAD
jgi:hypothetical protein